MGHAFDLLISWCDHPTNSSCPFKPAPTLATPQSSQSKSHTQIIITWFMTFEPSIILFTQKYLRSHTHYFPTYHQTLAVIDFHLFQCTTTCRITFSHSHTKVNSTHTVGLYKLIVKVRQSTFKNPSTPLKIFTHFHNYFFYCRNLPNLSAQAEVSTEAHQYSATKCQLFWSVF